ncbi:phenylalanine--tRNA ligase subunit beta [Mycoplasmopsis primatum]|uniref:phenylalanine--tRNA ligase subunit beta n=1 Tax=Mycoplasmopsis primatum TaxID=55604 RepID=UPI000494EE3B|nr:phenylalanine--tRNA ligase subunit beta [Mycoplasmopsis primatum]
MIISLRELNKFIPKKQLDASVEKDINNLGYEVESISKFSDVEGIKFGKIVNVQKNSNSDRLNIVELLTNQGKLTIQTTSKNAQIGYWTVAFVPGAKKGDIVFDAKKMAGVVSNGMLSGYIELGFNPDLLPYDPDGIILIKDDAITVDTNPIEYFGLDDYIIDITTPANRPESNSYYVLVMELAAYYRTEFKWPNLMPKDGYKFRTKIKAMKKEAYELSFVECKLKNKTTSLHDVLFLAKHNISSKGLYAIDLTNIALLITGSPTHVYDKDKLNGTLSCVKYSGEVEILGGKKVNIKDTLVIKDSKKVISLASVMGCESAAVDANTKTVVYEAGLFDPQLVRHGAKEIKIDSASSIQGGKALNSQITFNGIAFLKYKSIEDGHIVSQVVNLPKIKKGRSVIQSRKKLAIYSNCDFKDLKIFDETEEVLKNLGFSMDKNRVVCPTYRSDIECYEDVIEEYFRFYGYDKFAPVAPKLNPYKVAHNVDSKNMIQAMGYNEVRTFTLISTEQNKLNPFNFNKTVKLMTFVSKEREEIRNSIITSLLEVAEYNIKRKMVNLSLFEYGMINDNKFVYGLLSNEKSFDEMKQDICNFLKTDKLQFIPYKNNENIHPNVSAKIYYKDNFIGWIGKVHPVLNSLNVWVAEFYDINIQKPIIFEDFDNESLKSIDLTFTINKFDNISDQVAKINEISPSFSIQQIDDFATGETRNVTLKIIGTKEEISKINDFYNK